MMEFTLNETLQIVRAFGFCSGAVEALRISCPLTDSQRDGVDCLASEIETVSQMISDKFKGTTPQEEGK